MARGKELKCVSYVIMPDGQTIPADELTHEDTEQWQRNLTARLGEGMSDYFTQHPEEYAGI